jgi:hypothetical protein
MTSRASSLRSVLVDAGLYATAMALVAVASTFAYSQKVNDLRPDPRTTDNAIDSRQNTDDNLPSGDPTESFADAIQNQILGMTLFQDARGRAMVTDVSVNSPAWDAGIRKGDQLLELAEIKPTDFRKWSEDIRRVLGDTEDGKSVAATVARRGEPLSLRVKLPVSRAAEVRDARQEEEAIARQERQQRRQSAGQGNDRITEYRGVDQAPYGGYGAPGYGGGGFGFIGDDGANTTNDDTGRTPTRAVAELFAGGFSGGQVGLATFQNTDNGVGANVQVQGLPQGTYIVGIGDGSMGGFGNTAFDPSAVDPDGDGNFGNNVDPNSRRDDRNSRNNQNLRNDGAPRSGVDRNTPFNQQDPQQLHEIQRNQGQLPGGAAPGGQPNAQPMNVPAGGATPGGTSSDQSSSLAAPNASPILAQQFSQQNPTATNRAANPPAVAVNPGAARRPTPAPGDATRQDGNVVNPAIGNDGTNSTAAARGNNPIGANQNFGGGMPNFLAQIGTLTIGPNGAGQTQGMINGMTVQNLAGMTVSVVRATNDANGGNANPSPTNTDVRRPGHAVPPNSPALAGRNGPFGLNSGDVGPVASGVIRIVEGGGMPPGGVGTTDPDDLQNENARRANEELREQVEERQFTTPPDESFDPNNPTR